MAVLRAPPPFLPQPLLPRPSHSQSKRRRPTTCRGVAATVVRPGPAAPFSSRSGGGVHGGRRAKKGLLAGAARGRRPGEERVLPCLPATEAGVGAAGVAREEDEDDDGEYLAREAEWGVRRMGRVGEEMRRVAQVQAQAFYVPVALFDDFFKLTWRFLRTSSSSSTVQSTTLTILSYVAFDSWSADAASSTTKQAYLRRTEFSCPHSAEMLENKIRFRRKVGMALLKVCEALDLQWRHRFMVLRAYGDDDGA